MSVDIQGGAARCGAVDVAKLGAVAAVVWIHATASETSRELLPLARFAVPFFTGAVVYFVLCKASSPNVSFSAYCQQRAQRLYVPFLAWGLVYLLVRATKLAVLGSGAAIVMSPAILLNGSAHHLWFLPFACVVSIAAFALGQRLGLPSAARAKVWALTAFALGAGFSFIPCPVMLQPTESPITYFIDHAWENLPAMFFGAAVFWIARTTQPVSSLRWTVLGAGLLFLVWDFSGADQVIGPHMTAAALLFFSVTQPQRQWMESLRPWAELAFLVYLVHVLFVEALQTISERFGGVSSLSADLSVWALSLAASAITARFLLRMRALHWACPR